MWSSLNCCCGDDDPALHTYQLKLDLTTRNAINELVGVWCVAASQTPLHSPLLRLNRLSLVSGIVSLCCDGFARSSTLLDDVFRWHRHAAPFLYFPVWANGRRARHCAQNCLDCVGWRGYLSLDGRCAISFDCLRILNVVAIISYIGCFVLYRYELVGATVREERASSQDDDEKNMPRARGPPPRTTMTNATIAAPTIDFAGVPVTLLRFHPFGRRMRRRIHVPVASETHGIPNLPVDLVQVHTACVTMSAVGFLLAMIGIMTYLWSNVPQYVSIFATAMLGACIATGIFVLR